MQLGTEVRSQYYAKVYMSPKTPKPRQAAEAINTILILPEKGERCDLQADTHGANLILHSPVWIG